MRASLLRLIHTSLVRRATNLNYYGFPDKLRSLESSNPSVEEMDRDYAEMKQHFRHPVFQNFIPSYDEMKNPELAWMKRRANWTYQR